MNSKSKDTTETSPKPDWRARTVNNSPCSDGSLQSETKTCTICGKLFEPKNRNQTRCEEHLYRKTEARKIPNCLWCGKKLWKGDPNAFCSNDCRRDYYLDQYTKRRKENE